MENLERMCTVAKGALAFELATVNCQREGREKCSSW